MRDRAAAKLFSFVSSIDIIALSDELDIEVDTERLERVLGAIQQLSVYMISGVEVSMMGLAPHSANVHWLGQTIEQTGCLEEFSAPSGPIAVKGKAEASLPQNYSFPAPRRLAADIEERVSYTSGILSVAGAVFFGGIGYVLVKSRAFRRQRVQRMPRHLTSFPVVATAVADDGTEIRAPVTAHDISVGGMKIAWEEPPPKGAEVILALPIGEVSATIAWSNPYFAGMVFDKNLSAAEVDALTKTR